MTQKWAPFRGEELAPMSAASPQEVGFPPCEKGGIKFIGTDRTDSLDRDQILCGISVQIEQALVRTPYRFANNYDVCLAQLRSSTLWQFRIIRFGRSH